MNESKEAFYKWKADKGIQYNAAMAWQAAWDQQQVKIDGLTALVAYDTKFQSEMFDKVDVLKAQLLSAGYSDNGGGLMKPPVGKPPSFTLLDKKQEIIDELNTKNQRYLGKMQEQQDQIAELKKELKEWKSKSLAAMLHGTCNCGEPWQSIVSDKEGFNRLHCFKCNHDKYENKEFYGDHEPKE
jgi:hypothetical protein